MRFLANDRVIKTSAQASSAALDFIRGELGLTGTKEGCREGDCGACAVILGTRAPEDDEFSYRAMPSCLLALGELEGRHLVTIEGLVSGADAPEAKDRPRLTPVMKAISEANGSQCGFCSPGFVISLSAYLLNGDPDAADCSHGKLSVEGAARAVEGNLCRCTGYGAIRRAAARLVEDFAYLPAEPEARLQALVEAKVLPPSCLEFARGELPPPEPTAVNIARDESSALGSSPPVPLGGGSDYLVRNPEPNGTQGFRFAFLGGRPALKRITREGEVLMIGTAVSWREFFASPELRSLVPGIERYEESLASPLVRERATVGGNIVNASPVGDLTSMLIGLGAVLRITGPDGARREIPIERFFLGYKKLDLAVGEIVEAILIPAAKSFGLFNFEKVSKRKHLDIAAVNSAAVFELDEKRRIAFCRISAGGVAATPMLLEKTGAFLVSKGIDVTTVREASFIAGSEVKPISDVRGSADYRRRLLERLIIAHFIELFPGSGVEEAL